MRRFNVDPRLRTLARLINHALRVLRRNGSGILASELIPEEYRADSAQSNQAQLILSEFEIFESRGDGVCFRGPIKIRGLRQIVRGLNLCLWVLTSRSFYRHTSFESESELAELLALYDVPAKYTNGLRSSMKFAGIATLAARGLLFYRGEKAPFKIAPQRGLLKRASEYSKESPPTRMAG